MMNKRASIFAVGMVLAVIIFIGLAWSSFSRTNINLKDEFDATVIINSYNNQKNAFTFYLNDATKLAASQAFYEIAKKSAIDENQQCRIYDNYFIWSQNCKPDSESIKKTFIEKYNNSLYNFIEKYPKISFDTTLEPIEYYHILENPILNTNLSEKTFHIRKEANFANYNLTYEFKPSTILNLTAQEIVLEDFTNIYQEINNAVENCKDEENPVNCIENKNLIFKRWNFNLEKKASYLIFRFKTKKLFFFEDTAEKIEKFEPVVLNFAMHI